MGNDKAEHRLAQGRRIAAARRAAGLTQTALAARLLVSGQSVSMWEAGQTSPSPLRQATIAAVLGRDWADLFNVDDDGEAA